MHRVLADYAVDAVAVDPDGIGSGHDYIRLSYERNLPKFASLEMERTVQSHGDFIYVNWRAPVDQHQALVGSDTFVIHDELIRLHSFFSTVVSD